jgi:epoxyqueuosine reductase
MSLTDDIQAKAGELGIDKLGIVKVEAMLEYGERLQQRMDSIPNGEETYARFRAFADVRQTYPWAKSIVVVSLDFGHYVIPPNAKAHYGKSYLFDMRFNEDSPERQAVFALGDYMQSLGLQVVMDEHPGITAYRWAAAKAGLGIIRRNNFLYTERGSWSRLCAWAVSEEMELIHQPSLPACPPDCHKCIDACPTGSLFKPYTMDMKTCISSITASNHPFPTDAQTCKQLGSWIYGCDVCQDVCPMNHDKWRELDEFPELAQIDPYMSPEAILEMSYAQIGERLSKKFFYIKEENFWKWKLNAINVIRNNSNSHNPASAAALQAATTDDQQVVRAAAANALKEIVG